MSDLADKLNIDLDPTYLAGRACGTCKYFDKGIRGHLFSTCSFYSRYASTAQHPALCGLSHKNWEPIPAPIGLVGHIKRLLWGARK